MLFPSFWLHVHKHGACFVYLVGNYFGSAIVPCLMVFEQTENKHLFEKQPAARNKRQVGPSSLLALSVR